MGRKKVSTTIYLEADQLDRLRSLSERTRIPIATYIREGVDLVLAKRETGGES